MPETNDISVEEQVAALQKLVDEKQGIIDNLHSLSQSLKADLDKTSARAAMLETALGETQGHINTLCKALGRLL